MVSSKQRSSSPDLLPEGAIDDHYEPSNNVVEFCNFSPDVVNNTYNTLASVASAASAESEDEADTEVEDMAEHDTITSLGQFLPSARNNGDAAGGGAGKRLFSVLASRRAKMAQPASTSSSSISSRWAFTRS